MAPMGNIIHLSLDANIPKNYFAPEKNNFF